MRKYTWQSKWAALKVSVGKPTLTIASELITDKSLTILEAVQPETQHTHYKHKFYLSNIPSYTFRIIYSHHQAECEDKINCPQQHGRFEISSLHKYAT
jgi:hypothetical protein